MSVTSMSAPSPERSRTHQLARMNMSDLVTTYNELAAQVVGAKPATTAMIASRDRIITRILDLEGQSALAKPKKLANPRRTKK